MWPLPPLMAGCCCGITPRDQSCADFIMPRSLAVWLAGNSMSCPIRLATFGNACLFCIQDSLWPLATGLFGCECQVYNKPAVLLTVSKLVKIGHADDCSMQHALPFWVVHTECMSL